MIALVKKSFCTSKVPNIIFILILFSFVEVSSQNTPKSSLLFQLDNDLFFKSDQYYTNGIIIGFVPRKEWKPPWEFLFWPSKKNDKYLYSFRFVHEIFTPTNIDTSIILRGDRPYASTVSIGHEKIVFNSQKHFCVKTALRIGWMGRHALGEQIQNSIHAILPPAWPALGWDNQVNSDVVFSYSIQYCKEIKLNEKASIFSSPYLQVGFPRSNAEANLGFRYGIVNHIYLQRPKIKSKHLRYEFDIQFYSQLIAYDATLKGGWFNSDNVYVLNRIYPLLFGVRQHIRIFYKKYGLLLSSQYQTPEYKGGEYHGWNGMGFEYRF